MNEMATRETKRFHIGDLLSVTTGLLVSPRYMDGLYEILYYLTATPLDLAELEAARLTCRGYLLQEFPALAGVVVEEVSFESWRGWLETQTGLYGEWHMVPRPLPGQIDALT